VLHELTSAIQFAVLPLYSLEGLLTSLLDFCRLRLKLPGGDLAHTEALKSYGLQRMIGNGM